MVQGGESGNSFLKNLDRHLNGPIDPGRLYKSVTLLRDTGSKKLFAALSADSNGYLLLTYV